VDQVSLLCTIAFACKGLAAAYRGMVVHTKGPSSPTAPGGKQGWRKEATRPLSACGSGTFRASHGFLCVWPLSNNLSSQNHIKPWWPQSSATSSSTD